MTPHQLDMLGHLARPPHTTTMDQRVSNSSKRLPGLDSSAYWSNTTVSARSLVSIFTTECERVVMNSSLDTHFEVNCHLLNERISREWLMCEVTIKAKSSRCVLAATISLP